MPLGEQRYALELPLQPAPELLLGDLIAGGAQLVSLNPIRETLEDFFVRKVEEQVMPRFDAKKGGIVAMRVIRTIAVNVFRESVRDKVLYNLVFFAVFLIAVSYLLSQLTAGQDIKIIKDLGLGGDVAGSGCSSRSSSASAWSRKRSRSAASMHCSPSRSGGRSSSSASTSGWC